MVSISLCVVDPRRFELCIVSQIILFEGFPNDGCQSIEERVEL